MPDISNETLDEVERILGELSAAWDCAKGVKATTLGEMTAIAKYHSSGTVYQRAGEILSRLRAAREVK